MLPTLRNDPCFWLKHTANYFKAYNPLLQRKIENFENIWGLNPSPGYLGTFAMTQAKQRNYSGNFETNLRPLFVYVWCCVGASSEVPLIIPRAIQIQDFVQFCANMVQYLPPPSWVSCVLIINDVFQSETWTVPESSLHYQLLTSFSMEA